MLNYKCHVCISWRNGLFAYEGRRKGGGHWGTGARLHSFLTDKLILFQSGGAYYSHPIELYPLLFGKFRRACIQIQVQQLSICQKVLKSLGRPFDLLPNFKEELFSNFSCRFLNPNNFFQFELKIVLFFEKLETSRNKLKKLSVTKNCSDLSLFESIALLISKILKIVFSITRTMFSHSRSEQCW